MRLDVLALVLLVSAAPLLAQEAAPSPSPRQAYQRAEALFAQGHVFTAEEQAALDDLRSQLVESGDTDLAANLDLLRLGSRTVSDAEETKAKDKADLEADTQLWAEKERFLRDQGFWRGVRDGGLMLFTTATVATLLLAVTNDRNEGLLGSGRSLNDWSDKRAFANGMNWALLGSASTMFISLFPLLWGEARQ